MTCANCALSAVYVYDVSPSYGVYYCPRHLPVFLKGLAKAGKLTIPIIIKSPSKKKTTEPVDEAVVEEVNEDGVS